MISLESYSYSDDEQELYEFMSQAREGKKTVSELFALISSLEVLPEAPKFQATINELFQLIARQPFSLTQIDELVKRRGRPICEGERALLNRCKCYSPDLNKALLSYELLRRETCRMDLTKFKEIQIKAGNESFTAYDITGQDYRFLVHAADLNERSIEGAKTKSMKKGLICTSILSPETDFYHSYSKPALVLAGDPRNIVATTREDAYTPYVESRSTTEFYNFYQRLQIFTSYVDKLYRESGIQAEHATDPISRLNRLRALHLSHPEVQGEDAIASLERQIVPKSVENPNEIFNLYKTGIATRKIEDLIDFYKESPEKLSEIQKCKEMLQEIKEDTTIYRRYLHSIQGVGEILSQTISQPANFENFNGYCPYNEINFDLKVSCEPGKDPIEVKALLIHRAAFDQNPELFLKALKDAKQNQVPILIKDLSSPLKALHYLLITNGNSYSEEDFNKVLKTLNLHLDEESAGKTVELLSKYNCGFINCLSFIVKTQPNIPDRYLKAALCRYLETKNIHAIERLIEVIPRASAFLLSPAVLRTEDILFTISENTAKKCLEYLSAAGSPEDVELFLQRMEQVWPEAEFQELKKLVV